MSQQSQKITSPTIEECATEENEPRSRMFEQIQREAEQELQNAERVLLAADGVVGESRHSSRVSEEAQSTHLRREIQQAPEQAAQSARTSVAVPWSRRPSVAVTMTHRQISSGYPIGPGAPWPTVHPTNTPEFGSKISTAMGTDSRRMSTVPHPRSFPFRTPLTSDVFYAATANRLVSEGALSEDFQEDRLPNVSSALAVGPETAKSGRSPSVGSYHPPSPADGLASWGAHSFTSHYAQKSASGKKDKASKVSLRIMDRDEFSSEPEPTSDPRSQRTEDAKRLGIQRCFSKNDAGNCMTRMPSENSTSGIDDLCDTSKNTPFCSPWPDLLGKYYPNSGTRTPEYMTGGSPYHQELYEDSRGTTSNQYFDHSQYSTPQDQNVRSYNNHDYHGHDHDHDYHDHHGHDHDHDHHGHDHHDHDHHDHDHHGHDHGHDHDHDHHGHDHHGHDHHDHDHHGHDHDHDHHGHDHHDHDYHDHRGHDYPKSFSPDPRDRNVRDPRDPRDQKFRNQGFGMDSSQKPEEKMMSLQQLSQLTQQERYSSCSRILTTKLSFSVCDLESKEEMTTGRVRTLPKKPQLTKEQINDLIRCETQDVDTARVLYSDDKKSYKKPCPKQQKAQMNVKQMVSTHMSRSSGNPCEKEFSPLQEPDPDDLSPDVAAKMMFSQEVGVNLKMCPSRTIKYLFPDDHFRPRTTHKSMVSVMNPSDEVEMLSRSSVVPEDGASDSAYSRKMKNKAGEDIGSHRSYDVDSTAGGEKREYVVVGKKPDRFNMIQFRGNLPPWFPGYFAAFPDQVKAVSTVGSPTVAFNKAWATTNPSNIPPKDVVVLES